MTGKLKLNCYSVFTYLFQNYSLQSQFIHISLAMIAFSYGNDPSCKLRIKSTYAPPPPQKRKRRERGERKRERKKKEKRGFKRGRKLNQSFQEHVFMGL